MNKDIIGNIEICLSNFLENAPTLEQLDVIKQTIIKLEETMGSFMEQISSCSSHLSESQRLLVGLVVDEHKLVHLPKIKLLLLLTEKIENTIKLSVKTLH